MPTEERRARFSDSSNTSGTPIGDQLRKRVGVRECPDSSIKTTFQPLSRDFFYMRPLVPKPMFNRLRRMFSGAFDRLFRRIADLAKDATRLGFGVRDTELILDQLPDATACPNGVCVAELRGTFFEESLEFGQLFFAESRRATGPWPWCQSADAILTDDSSPKSDGRKAATEDVGDFLIAVTLFDELPALHSAVL